jgi:hypothetical protein
VGASIEPLEIRMRGKAKGGSVNKRTRLNSSIAILLYFPSLIRSKCAATPDIHTPWNQK